VAGIHRQHACQQFVQREQQCDVAPVVAEHQRVQVAQFVSLGERRSHQVVLLPGQCHGISGVKDDMYLAGSTDT